MNRAEKHQLETLLRQHAKEDVPAFSAELHQRVMGALRAQGLPQPAAREAAGRSWGSVVWKIGVPLAAAAAIAVVAWIALQPAPSPVSKDPHPVVEQQRIPSPLEIPEVKAPALTRTNAIKDARYAYLDRDARKLWMFVASQIPELPAEKKDR